VFYFKAFPRVLCTMGTGTTVTVLKALLGKLNIPRFVIFLQMKRGMNIQFSWIYVSIVGAVLIIVAISIISGIKKSADYSLVSDVKMYVDNSFRNIQLNHGAWTLIDLPDVEIDIFCDTFSVSRKDSTGWPLSDIIIFSPQLIKGQMLGYSASFRMPFEAEYLTYVTSPGVEYVFEDSELGKKAYDLFPNNTDKAFRVDKDEKNYQTRFIEFDDTFDDENTVKISLMDDAETFPESFGKVSFADDEEAYFFGRESLLGALYSEDIERYECNLKKMLGKLGIISDMKKDKLEEYAAKFQTCPYGKSIDLLNQMAEATRDMKTDQLSMKRIYVLAASIKKENGLLQRLSCPIIY
jgi:hypothetical protein